MMLGSELEGFIVVDSLGEEIGKVKDVLVDTTKEKWHIKEIVFSGGILKGEGVFSFSAIKKFNESEKRIEFKEGTDLREYDEKKFSRRYLSMDSVKKREVFGSDEEEIGKIYDYVLATSLTPWKVIKILIRPHEHRLKGRRIRLNVKNISKIKDVITVKQSKDEAEKKASKE